MINVGKKSTKNLKIKKRVKKEFSKKKVNSNIMMFENVNVKDLNARTFMIFYIDDTMSFADILISRFLFKFENFLNIESKALTETWTKEKNRKKSCEKTIKNEQMSEFLFFV